MIAGHYTDVGDSAINAHQQINRKHLEIRGCWGSEARHFLRALALLERHAAEIPWRRIGAPHATVWANSTRRWPTPKQMRIPKALVDPWA